MEFFNRHKRAFLLSGVFICIAAIILTINPALGSTIFERGLSLIVTPLQRGANATISWVQGHFTALTNNQGLVAENAALRLERDILLQENFRLQQAGIDNEYLSNLLNMQQRYPALEMVGARVISRDPNDWNRRFHIDLGSRDGITSNMAVLSEGGLVGVTRQVNLSSTRIFSIIDPHFSAAVMSLRTGDIGIVSGDIELMRQGLIRMDNIDASAQIIPGDEIVISTFSTIFPVGVRVGTVLSLHPNPDELTQHAIVRPIASLDNLEMVLVITDVAGEPHLTRDEPIFVMEE